MKKVVILFTIFLLFPLISSEIIIDKQPNAVYNLGDVVTVPITIKALTSVSGYLNMYLICGGRQENFERRGINLMVGDEKKIDDISLILTKNDTKNMLGTCKIKATLGEDYALTNEFKISDLVTLRINFEKIEFSPGEAITISGEASKENGNPVEGLIEISIIENNISRISQMGTITRGSFSTSLSLPEAMKARAYLLRINAYEQDINNGLTTNKGFMDQNILIKQVPTSLEIVFENQEIEPGTNLNVKAVLHDQTGEKIQSLSFISIKNGNNKILDQVEVNTDEFHEFPVAYNEPPASWKIVAVSNKITSEANLAILKKEAIKVEIINTTLIITNTGNVPYNKTALINIGNESVNIDLYLKVGESQKYAITAPDGSYNVKVTTGEESAEVEQIALTGRAIDVRKASGSLADIVKHPFIWAFVVIILVLGIAIIMKKRSRRNFFGNITSRPSGSSGSSVSSKPFVSSRRTESYENANTAPLTKGSLINSRNKAEISLSLKGEKKEVSLVALNIRNLGTVSSKDGSAIETLQKIVNMAEDKRAATYEDNNSIIFILSPTITRTNTNEKTALDIAQATKDALVHHNKMFRQRMDFGISLGYGPIIEKYENRVFQFSSIDSTISSTKKISSLAEGEILLSEKMNDKLKANVKAVKQNKSGTNVYSIKEIKNAEQNASFVKSFSEKFKKEHKEE